MPAHLSFQVPDIDTVQLRKLAVEHHFVTANNEYLHLSLRGRNEVTDEAISRTGLLRHPRQVGDSSQ
jgi:hypothetical protein